MKAATAIEWRALRRELREAAESEARTRCSASAAVAGARIMSRDDTDAGAAGKDERGAKRVRDQTLLLHQ